MPPAKTRLDQVRDLLRVKHESFRTEQVYVTWIERFILFHDKRHPREMGRTEISAFLTHTAVEDHVTPSTQTRTNGMPIAVRQTQVTGPSDAYSTHHRPFVQE